MSQEQHRYTTEEEEQRVILFHMKDEEKERVKVGNIILPVGGKEEWKKQEGRMEMIFESD